MSYIALFPIFFITFAFGGLIMYCSYIYPETNVNSLDHHFYPPKSSDNNLLPSIFSITSSYRLFFSTMPTEENDAFFICTYIDPSAIMYSVISKEDDAAVTISAMKFHKHDFYEFMFVLDGELYVNIENQRHLYSKGCCYIVNRNVRHAEEYTPSFRAAFFQIHPDFLHSIYTDLCMDFFDIAKNSPKSKLMDFLHLNLTGSENSEKDYVDFIPIANNTFLTNSIHSIFDQITRETLSPQIGSSITVKQLILKLFLFLLNPDYFNTSPIRIGSDAEYTIYTQIVNAMIDNHGRISRNELAKELNYSGAYLNEISKKYSGLSLFDFSMTFCMKEAARLLSNSDMNIVDIGNHLGFSNRTHFYKIFKKTYHVTPAEYRRHSRQQ